MGTWLRARRNQDKWDNGGIRTGNGKGGTRKERKERHKRQTLGFVFSLFLLDGSH
jgi:hypothetical protein